jgi:hypothetical protein
MDASLLAMYHSAARRGSRGMRSVMRRVVSSGTIAPVAELGLTSNRLPDLAVSWKPRNLSPKTKDNGVPPRLRRDLGDQRARDLKPAINFTRP